MRLWSVHPQYLDSRGLVALWREGLLAQKVLAGKTKGYRHHPQLHRFQETKNPLAAIGFYLNEIANEAEHLMRKLKQRDPARFVKYKTKKIFPSPPDVHHRGGPSRGLGKGSALT